MATTPEGQMANCLVLTQLASLGRPQPHQLTTMAALPQGPHTTAQQLASAPQEVPACYRCRLSIPGSCVGLVGPTGVVTWACNTIHEGSAASCARMFVQDNTAHQLRLGHYSPWGVTDARCYVSGDTAVSRLGLARTTIDQRQGVVFVLEHNSIVDMLRNKYHTLSGNEMYERARRIVGAEIQNIAYG